MKECVEEGMIQAYVDGELSPEAASQVAAHAALCEQCAAVLAEAESELSFLAVALEPEFGAPVPSERLRERLHAAIGELRAQAVAPAKAPSGNLKGWLASLVPSINFAPRYAAGFASLVVFVAFAAIFATLALRRQENQTLLAAAAGGMREIIFNDGVRLMTDTQPPSSNGQADVDVIPPRPSGSKEVRRVAPSPRTPRANSGNNAATQVALSNPLPGEESYLKTIASLSSVIETNGENAIKPSIRADYERNLALVDQAISATQRTARRNPKNPDAAEVLYSSYQSKIDLLSAVAEQGQMLAAR